MVGYGIWLITKLAYPAAGFYLFCAYLTLQPFFIAQHVLGKTILNCVVR